MADDVVDVQAINQNEARVNVTWQGQNGDLEEAVFAGATDTDVKRMVEEALRGGDIRGIAADPAADLQNFVVDRFAPSDASPYARIMIRPKTAFGF